MNGWSFAASVPVCIAALLMLIATGYLCLVAWQRNHKSARHLRLESFKFVLAMLVVFSLLQPEYVRITDVKQDVEVVVLTDESDSMQTRDLIGDDQRAQSRATWVATQLVTSIQRPLASLGKVHVESFSPTRDNPTVGTDINAGLERVLAGHPHLRAVLLLSDGDWNSGDSPMSAATRYRLRKIPVFAVATGSDRYLPDLRLDYVNAPSYGLLDEFIVIPFGLRSHLDADVTTRVMLTGTDGTRESKEVVLPAGQLVHESFLFRPKNEGSHSFTLRVPLHPDEVFSDNNTHAFQISFRREILNVLVIDTVPRWEYRYLRNALVRDPGVKVDCLLLHPEIGAGSGPHYLQSFPDTIDALSTYDVVFLGDIGVGKGELNKAQADLLAGLVEHHGSGLVFLPGMRGRQRSLAGTALDRLNPVLLDPAHPDGYRNSIQSQLVLTRTGRGHLLTMLAENEDANADAWRILPGFYWNDGVLKSKPGTRTLAVHDALRNRSGRLPLLVIRDYGSGKALFMGTDSAWRWRRGVEDKYHYRFWGQVVRWMAHRRHLAQRKGLRLFMTPETPSIGETVYLHVTAFNDSGLPVDTPTLPLTVSRPSGTVERLPLTSSDQKWGTFTGSFVPEEAGTYGLTLNLPDSVRVLSADLPVDSPRLEKLGRPVRSDVLREIASISGGQYGESAEIERIVEAIRLLPERKPLEKRFRLWSNPFWGGFLVALLGLYWTGRKLLGTI